MPAHPTAPPLQAAALTDSACPSSRQQRGREANLSPTACRRDKADRYSLSGTIVYIVLYATGPA